MRGDTYVNLQGKMQHDIEAVSPEKQEEMKLMNKLASRGELPAKGPSSFLQKRLQQRKFFDSGDYAMDKAKNKDSKLTGVSLRDDKMSSPSALLNVNVQGQNLQPPYSASDELEATSPTGLEIPRPETVPQRKSSLIYPSAHSKLSPQPHLHQHEDAFQDFV